MEPAVLGGVFVGTTSADDGVVLEVIHARDKNSTEENQKEVELMVELEEIIVMQDSIASEILFQITRAPTKYRHDGGLTTYQYNTVRHMIRVSLERHYGET